MKNSILKITVGIFLIFIATLFASCQILETLAGVDTTPSTTEPDETTTEVADTVETEEPETEAPADIPIDPSLYEPIPQEEYGLTINSEKRPCGFTLGGTLQTSTGTSLNMIVKWSAERDEGEDFVIVNLDLAIEHKAIKSPGFPGTLKVNGEEFHFSSPFYEYRLSSMTREWICPVEIRIPCNYGEEVFLDVEVKWDFVGVYERRQHDGISLMGRIPIGEKYANLKNDVNYDIVNILQNPELPEGCEITSLAILLNYLGFDITHTYLADNYLEQGEAGKTNFYEKNVGNPREAGKSWGCYAPVIVKSANRFLLENESRLRAFDLSGYDISELYYQVSMGNPAIVWVTMDFEEPYLKNPWTVDNEVFWWKYPLHCVVMSGYDFEAGTVTLTDPMKNEPVIVDIQTFETRFRQMESQAVVIKPGRSVTK